MKILAHILLVLHLPLQAQRVVGGTSSPPTNVSGSDYFIDFWGIQISGTSFVIGCLVLVAIGLLIAVHKAETDEE